MKQNRRKNRPIDLTKHHVPPRHPNENPQFILRKNWKHHQAYHLLFGAARSYEEACQILLRDWWTPENEIRN